MTVATGRAPRDPGISGISGVALLRERRGRGAFASYNKVARPPKKNGSIFRAGNQLRLPTEPLECGRVSVPAGHGPWPVVRVRLRMPALRGSVMEKWLCWAGTGVGALMLILFALDFILNMAGVETYLPFGGLSGFVDIVCALASGLLLYLSISALRELK
jgi:hypothetical protein